MANYLLSPCVEKELNEIWEYIAKDNPDAAGKVIQAAEKTFQLLADNPGLGHPKKFNSTRIKNLRVGSVQGFGRYLVFYQEIHGGIEIFHVYHGARNINALLRK